MELSPAVAEGRRITVQGIVQGVGFRPWVYRLARKWGVTGRVHNDSSGVTIDAFGDRESLDQFLHDLEASPPPAAAIRALLWESIPHEAAPEFTIVHSRGSAERHVSIPPDIATCDECLEEVFDARDRRYRYPFTNCTNCGPRFTITRDVPYDRPATTMAPFVMCPDCRREYDSVEDRRFHAQPNACPACGPRLHLVDGSGSPVTGEGDAITLAARALREGKIVAVKGIGGFHLACLAEDGHAVERLRERKHRDEKPFAVMVRNLDAAELLAVLSDAERELLTSVERPIVLVTRRAGAALAEEVAPRNPLVGLLLAYTPLHHLLLADTGGPLVMTSANRSDEPLAYRNVEALERLHGIADLFLIHDREIETRCDDSIARVIAGRPAVLRRSRGWVPRAVPVCEPFKEPVLATGGHLKNTFCIGIGASAFLGPHIGDLEGVATMASFEESVARMERFLGVQPKVIAHDMHPAYSSTAWARDEAVKRGGRTVAVQHHHAHVVSAMAEHGIARPVLGLAFDGTGYGPDGTAWGGEFLLADADAYRRIATFRPLALPGGERAIHEPWRIALGLLDDVFGIEGWSLGDYPLFRGIGVHEISIVRRMIAQSVNAPLAHGVGRWFDAFGALGLAKPHASYEGQIALEWSCLATPGRSHRSYTWDLSGDGEPWVVDLRPAARAAAIELRGGANAARVSAKFHETIIAASAEVVRMAMRAVGRVPVVLTGGCFQNVRLTEGLLEELSGQFDVLVHGAVPPGDGGLALGQAVIAAAATRKDS